MHAFRKLRARIFRIRKTRVYDTARSVCTKALGAFRKKEKKKKEGRGGGSLAVNTDQKTDHKMKPEEGEVEFTANRTCTTSLRSHNSLMKSCSRFLSTAGVFS